MKLVREMFLLRILKSLGIFFFTIWHLLGFPCLVCASLLQTQATTMLTAANTTLPGCPRKCGNVTIPYPFGIGRSCSLGYNYVVVCDTEKNFSVPRISGRQILDISETQITVIDGRVASSCNFAEEGSGEDGTWSNVDLTGQPYSLSSASNIFVVTGCRHYGLIEAQTTTGREVASCVALCTREEDLRNKMCSGIGCCEAPIPKGLKFWNISLENIYYNTSVSSGNCSYAYILEKSTFYFLGLQGQDSGYLKSVPVVLDWFIPNERCKDAQKNSTTYACQQNTNCIDLGRALNVIGYRCKCLHGYQGNPYLSPGCIEIDECAGVNNPCSSICVNTQGNYECYCPSGFYGDGRKDGTGCRSNSLKLILVLGLGLGLGSILLLLSGFWLFIIARRRRNRMQRAKCFKQNGGLLLQQKMWSKDGMIEKTRIFTADELEKATDGFNENRVLGQGGQGKVYKGMLSDGNVVAIKKSNIGNSNGLSQFINEVVILSEINHRNIVNLLGCCLETEVPLLVYEFIPNGALSKYIHGPSEDFPITWEMRLQIAIDVAGALTYLHSASSKPVFHRDVKTSNILLDAKYRAKLSDFGTSRSVGVDQTHLTTRIQGTFGYLDPEYFRSNQFTDKSDVYGFGVVLVELLTGKRAVIPTESHNGRSLVSYFLSTMENSNLYDILDAQVAKEGREEAIFAVSNLAKRCVNIDGKQRPTMREAALELEVISQLRHAPVSTQKNQPEVTAETLTEINYSLSDSLVPPDTSYMEENWSFPSTGSRIQHETHDGA
ncbi:wall-associated receptor kinase-like 1 isoform X1 [Chenopodium quinoa]|uniref:Uncharacterized protein n=1 Tax=Chenopodium quinoa TaxID=63459 RepID=A0A803KMU9_CHEQI|nr:wall-associated receptor kinase-like 1 isoform X1 [Chenopodium quinoa]XP_021772371.1 wall-associated receptor kinase-like 1 isoform X1 [Chenopodium quinoa]